MSEELRPDVLRAVRRIEDERGTLAMVECGIDIDFPIRRVYWLSDLTPTHPRGFHAHRALRQFAVCVAGGCRIVLEYPSGKREEIALHAGGGGVAIGPMVWREMHDFTPDCVLLVLADQPHDECDYLRTREEWKKACGG